MYSMPYGVVEKLKSLNWKINNSNSSGRTLFCFPNHINWYLIDNGIVGNHRWVFLSMPFNDFEFGNNYQPLDIKFTSKDVEIIANIKIDKEIKKITRIFSYEDYENLKILLDAYHVNRNYIDDRPEYFNKLIKTELEKIDYHNKEIENTKQKINELEKKKQYILDNV